ncbi:MAG: GHKL domain-containing protein [Cycloclasticus sp.]|nr:GHKL domain-containing protein [Cycloclasticus sp.]
MNSSIQYRLIVSASVVLVFFLSLAGFILDAAYQKGAQNALNERLQIHLYSILAKAELSKNNRLVLPAGLSEPRFAQIDSGLYAYVFNQNGDAVWRSSSSTGEKVTTVESLNAGQKTYIQRASNDHSWLELHYKAVLENSFKQSTTFEFVIIESTRGVDSQVSGFRSVLWKWLGGIGLLLIVVQYFIIRKSLQPLRDIVADLEGIHRGDSQLLVNHYSDELKDIANTLNDLISNERTHLQRYRNTLADLAHSLKTPLSILTGLYDQAELNPGDIKTLAIQTNQMQQLVDYQLQKAAVKGHQTLSAPLQLHPIVEQIKNSLDKVYLSKTLNVTLSVDTALKFNAEKGDMFELFGNLLDNAYKWAKSTVSVSVKPFSEDEKSGIQIIIEDDGPGISNDELTNVLERGIRADETVQGHGIGLAVVKELVTQYKGTLSSQKSASGGQKWVVFLSGKTS